VPAITVKNIPPELYERLKRSAQANRRSINSEIIFQIEHALSPHRIEPEVTIARARKLRDKTAEYEIGDEELGQVKKAGRL
jgi:hypothetical protein